MDTGVIGGAYPEVLVMYCAPRGFQVELSIHQGLTFRHPVAFTGLNTV